MPQARFFSTKMTFLFWGGYVIALLRSSYVPQAFFFGKNDVPWIFRTCNNAVEVSWSAAHAFCSAKSDSQMALAIFVMGEDL